MQTKKIPHIIISIISLLILGYVLYVSVYNQIISQSDGFFNMIIFAGILLLVFILLSLVVKLMAYTPTKDISPMLKYAFVAAAVCLVIVSFFLRANYSSSVPADESSYFQICEYINEGTLADAYDVSDDLMYNQGYFSFAFFSSIIFKIIDLNPDYIVFINIFYLSICAIFTFLLVSLISDRVCGFLAFLLALFMPGNTFAVYSYGYQLFFAGNFIVVVYLLNLLIHKKFDKIIFPIIISILAGIFSGIMIFTEPTSILLFIALYVWVICKKKQGVIPIIILPVLSLIVYFVFVLIKSQMMMLSFGEVLVASLSSFDLLFNNITGDEYTISELFSQLGNYIDNQNQHIIDNYYFLTSKSGNTYSSLQAIWLQLGNQLIFMFLIIMSVANIIYLLKSKVDRVSPYYSVLVASFFVHIFTTKYATNGLYFCFILITIGASTIQQMFLNHHPDASEIFIEMEDKGTLEKEEPLPVLEDPEVLQAKFERANAVAFYGVNDSLYEKIKLEEKESKNSASIAATKIHTGFEDGKYVSKVEEVEYFDEVDTPVEQEYVPEVKAIPGTRPVEVVKPILADDPDMDDNNATDDNLPAFRKPLPKPKPLPPVISTTEEPNIILPTEANNNDYLDEPDTFTSESDDNNIDKENNTNNESSSENLSDGFVIRKRDKSAESNASINKVTPLNKNNKVEAKSKDKNKDEAKSKEKKSLFGNKNKKSKTNDNIVDENNALLNDNNSDLVENGKLKESEKAKKGQPLDNPLPLPKPHVSKDLDFDFDVSDDDDFDV